MSLGPLNVASIIERVRTRVPALKLVGGAAHADRIEDGTVVFPCAFVVLAAEDIVSVPMSSGVHMCTVNATIDVFVGVQHHQVAKRGEPAAEAGVPIVAAIRGALNNWTPVAPTDTSADTICSKGRSQFIGGQASEWWWRDRYQVTYRGRA